MPVAHSAKWLKQREKQEEEYISLKQNQHQVVMHTCVMIHAYNAYMCHAYMHTMHTCVHR